MEKVKLVFQKIRGGVLWFFKKIGAFVKEHKVWSALIIIALILAIVFFSFGSKKKKMDMNASNDVAVQRRDVQEKVTGSSVVEPNAEYTIVPLVTGEILEAPFEEGDYVTKGQMMYRFDAATMENSIASADLNIKKAQQNYNDALSSHSAQTADISVKSADVAIDKAQQSYQDAVDALDDLYVKADVRGTVREVLVKNGDSVNNGTKIASVYDNSTMKARIPFNASDADSISVGDTAVLTLVGTGSILSGTVTQISSASQTTSGHMLVRYVTIEVTNPGALMEGDSATAMVGTIACNDVGTFEAVEDKAITAKTAGTLSSVDISEGDYVTNNMVVALIESSSANSQLKNAELSLLDAELAKQRSELSAADDNTKSQIYSAKISLDDAVLSKEKLLKQLEDYTITAPISGTVVTKNKKAGDKYESGSGGGTSAASSSSASSSGSSSGLAVIYDMSSLYFSLDIDELDVKKISVGQKVKITADASEKEYTGEVENVSVNGTAGTNGVTTYPVKIRITDFDSNLLPGMNIEAEISIQSASNVMAVPVGAVNRGDIVYVKGEKTEENDRAPEGYRSVKVTTGVSDDEFIEIVSGLSEGDSVYLQQQTTEQNTMMMMGPGGMGGGAPGGGGSRSGGGGGGAPGGGGGMRR